MLETRTRLQAAIPADRSANSKLVSFSRCFPTPFVKNILFGTNITVALTSFQHPDGPESSVSDRPEATAELFLAASS